MEIIIGAVVSLIVQWLKQHVKTTWETFAILVLVSLAAAGLYTVLVNTGYWQTVAGILLTAGAFYAYIIQRFEGSDTSADPVPATAPTNLPTQQG